MKISLVIPTRERREFLKESLKTALAAPGDRFEIIVSDNASADETRQTVAAFKDQRLKYVNTGKRVSMRQNFEFALEECSGDYISIIGDDDAFLPQQLRQLQRLLDDYSPDVLSWRRPTFRWGLDNDIPGVRLIRKACFGRVQEFGATELQSLLSRANISAMKFSPGIYHGCVRRNYLESLRGRNGQIFNGSSPDVYFGIAAIVAGGRFVHANHTFSINGISRVSIGNASHAYKSTDPLGEPANRFFREASIDSFTDVIEAIPRSLPFCMFSMLENARHHLDRQDFAVDYGEWYSYILGFSARAGMEIHENVLAILTEHARRTGNEGSLAKTKGALSYFNSKTGKLFEKFSRLRSFKVPVLENGLSTVNTASRLVDRILADDYAKVLDRSMSSSKAWQMAKRRGAAEKAKSG